MLDAMRGYLQIAEGLSALARERAVGFARSALAQTGVDVDRLGATLADLASAGRSNQALLVNFVRAEIDRTVAALGVVSAADVAKVTASLDRLERRLAALEAAVEEPGGPAPEHHGGDAPVVSPDLAAARRATPPAAGTPTPPAAARAPRKTAARKPTASRAATAAGAKAGASAAGKAKATPTDGASAGTEAP